MFGTLRPSLCKLPSDDRQAYRQAYCGTCKALGDNFGQLARPLLSYDVVFFAALIEATQSEKSETGQCRCPLLPVLQKPILATSSISVQFAAAIQVVLASAWLDDQVLDGSTLYKPPHALLRSKAERAYTQLSELGMDVSIFKKLSAQQLEVEKRSKDLEILATPTGNVLSAVLSAIPTLRGSVAMSAGSLEAMDELGQALGLAIYAIDALEDLESDVKRSQFNPCLDESGRVKLSLLDSTCTMLGHSLTRIQSSLEKIELPRGQAAVRAALGGVRRRANIAIGKASEMQAHLVAVRPQSSLLRSFSSLLAIVSFLPLYFFAMGKRVGRKVLNRVSQSPDKSACAHSQAFAAHGGPDGHSFGSGLGNPGGDAPITGMGRRGRKRKKKEKEPNSCCCDADCCCDCLCCYSCCGDSDSSVDCCCDACCDGDCCSCDCDC